MFLQALFDPLSILVLVIIILLGLISFLWFLGGQRQFHTFSGALRLLKTLGMDLPPSHPIRKRLESAPVVDLSLEEIAKFLSPEDEEKFNAARGLVELGDRINWIERFSQYSIHLGILGTVAALVSSDPTDLDAFRASLPLALGTTFWGLIGALLLSTIAGASESILEKATRRVREALLDELDEQLSHEVAPVHPFDLGSPNTNPESERDVHEASNEESDIHEDDTLIEASK